MPLSEEEQRILHEMEEKLYEHDRAFADRVSTKSQNRPQARSGRGWVVAFIAGFVLLLVSFGSSVLLGSLGFLIMLAATVAFVTVSTTTTVEAIAAGGGYGTSRVTSGTYTINAAQQSEAIVGGSLGGTIYTTNSSTPTTASTQNTEHSTASATTTAEAFAAGVEYGASTAASGTYKITPATPTFSPAAFGNFTTPQSVTIADDSPNVVSTTRRTAPRQRLYQPSTGDRSRSQSPPQSGPSLPEEGTARAQ